MPPNLLNDFRNNTQNGHSMKKIHAAKKDGVPYLSLHPVKVEEALSLFIQVDPARVETDMRRLRQKSGKTAALPKG